MKCVKCKKELQIPNKAYINLESYNVGGQVLIASECCNMGYVLKMNVSYTISEYKGDKKEDEWGVKLKTR